MLNLMIVLLFVLGMVVCSIKDEKYVSLIYVLGTFLAPVARIVGIDFSFDVLCFPLLFVLYIWKRRSLPLFKGKDWYFLPYASVYLLLTVINAVMHNSGISVATLYAVARFVLVANMIRQVWRGKMNIFIDRLMTVVLLVNTICSILQIFRLTSVELFHGLYYKSSMTPLNVMLELGYFNRAFGTTGSPVLLGSICVLAFVFYTTSYIQQDPKVKGSIPKICMILICAFFALSKTAILAMPIVTLFMAVLCVAFYGKKSCKMLVRFTVLVAVELTVVFLIVWIMREQDTAINYYLQYITNPLKALETRYGSESGILNTVKPVETIVAGSEAAVHSAAEHAAAAQQPGATALSTMDVLKMYWLIGVGHTQFQGAFIGDSAYLVVMYQTGIVGLMAYGLPYVLEGVCTLKEKNLFKGGLLAAVFLIAIGSALQLSYYLIPFAAALFESKSEVCENNK